MESNVILGLPVISFKGENHTLKELTIGALLDIEVMKSTLTNGFYGELVSNKTTLSNWSLDNVDMFANLMVLTPTLVKNHFASVSWRDMSPEDTVELRKEYSEKFLPWFEKRITFLNPPKTEVEDKDTKSNG